MNHEHLYFITFDNSHNVFGHYHPSSITTFKNNDDNDIFFFTLNTKQCHSPMKYKPTGKGLFTCIYEGSNFYSCWTSDTSNSGYYIDELSFPDSYIGKNIAESFENMQELQELYYPPNHFTAIRIVVIEMK